MSGNPPQRWQESKHDLEVARKFIALIGAPYHGGGGGVGKIFSLVVNAQVYHQEFNGAKNYHDIPRPLADALANVVKGQARELLAKAILLLETQVAERAKLARDYLADIERDLQRDDQ